MNIHEYQAKAVLREFGVPVPRGIAAMSVEEAVKAAERTRRAGLGGEGADPRRRTRQSRRRQGGEIDRRREARGRAAARFDAGHAPDRTARQTGAPPLHRGRLRTSTVNTTSPRWSTARPRGIAFVASTEGGMDIEEVARTRPEKISASRSIRRPVSWRHHARAVARALGFAREVGQAGRDRAAEALSGVSRQGHEPARDQSAGRHQGRRADLPRRQDRLRRQRALSASRYRRRCAIRPKKTPRRSRRRATI